MEKVICEYCATLNDLEATECQACGAPLPKSESAAVVAVDFEPALDKTVFEPGSENGTEQLQKMLNTAASVYGILWRTLAEAGAIALTAFMIGVVGAVNDMAFGAIVGAVLVGVMVGAVSKGFWLTLIGAPIGGIIGAALGMVAWSMGFAPGWAVLLMCGGAILGAWLGSYRLASGTNWWERFRPLLGALGAFFFVMLGILLGEGFQQFFRLMMSV